MSKSSGGRLRRIPVLALAAVAAASTLWAADPVVSNVRARQLPGSGQVEVLYDLSGAPAQGATVSVVFSVDGGGTFGIVPAGGTLSGQVGAGVRNGLNRQLVWDAAATLGAGAYGVEYRARVTAVDPGEELLLWEDFSGGVVPMGWEVDCGSASVVSHDSNFRLQLSSNSTIRLPGSYDRSDSLIFQADVKIMWDGFGDFNLLAFFDSYLYCSSGFPNNGYLLGIYPAGSDNPTDRLLSCVAGTSTLLNEAPTTAGGNTWVNVKVVFLQGSLISVEVDGVNILSASESTHTIGNLAIRAHGTVYVDNVKVATLGGS